MELFKICLVHPYRGGKKEVSQKSGMGAGEEKGKGILLPGCQPSAPTALVMTERLYLVISSAGHLTSMVIQTPTKV